MTIRLSGHKISFANPLEFWQIYKDLFIQNTYFFNSNDKSPLILDCGGHIGVSVLYFKKLYPNSQIICFEPDPKNQEYFKRNVEQNNLKEITLIPAALSDKNGTAGFFSSKNWSILNKSTWSWGNSLVKHPEVSDATHKVIKVQTVKLSSYINKPVEMLKIDIEGAETLVLNEIKNKLGLVRNIVIEFHHSGIPKGNSLDKIISILEKSKFRLTFRKGKKIVSKKGLKARDAYVIVSGARI